MSGDGGGGVTDLVNNETNNNNDFEGNRYLSVTMDEDKLSQQPDEFIEESRYERSSNNGEGELEAEVEGDEDNIGRGDESQGCVIM